MVAYQEARHKYVTWGAGGAVIEPVQPTLARCAPISFHSHSVTQPSTATAIPPTDKAGWAQPWLGSCRAVRVRRLFAIILAGFVTVLWHASASASVVR
jgi:hypothetical protein